jgi:uncharacterized protein YbjT (DUF2867 family)
MKIKAIVTGVTGMVGEGVAHECLLHPDVEEVLVIVRRPSGMRHPKLKEIVHSDFFNVDALAETVKGYNACYFCLGVSSVGMNEADYTKMTHTLTMGFAGMLAKANPDITFCYVSGASTDSTEKGRMMWARVKGRTENDLMKLFRNAYMFRPGYMHPTRGLKNTIKFYKYITWMYPFMRVVMKNSVSTLAELGQAMISVTQKGYDKKVLEVKDIVKAAKRI